MPTVETEFVIYYLEKQTPGMFPDKSRPPFTMADMENVIDTFDYDYLKPPCHNGHPKGDATDLAYGSVHAVRLDGQKLIAKVSVQESVKEDFDEERLLALSSEFYRTFEGKKGVVLKGLGFLGATNPRQKGLNVSHFSEDEKGDYDTIVFSDNQEPGETPMEPTVAQPTLPSVVAAGTLYTDEQIAAGIESAVKAALEANEKSEKFAEAEKASAQLKKDNEQLKKDLEAQLAKGIKDDHEAFAESDEMKHATPVQKSCAVALLDQFETTEIKESGVEVFAEDGTSKNLPLREMIASMTKPAGKSIKDTLRTPHARTETGAGSKAGDMTVENFAECEATPVNLEQLASKTTMG